MCSCFVCVVVRSVIRCVVCVCRCSCCLLCSALLCCFIGVLCCCVVVLLFSSVAFCCAVVLCYLVLCACVVVRLLFVLCRGGVSLWWLCSSLVDCFVAVVMYICLICCDICFRVA